MHTEAPANPLKPTQADSPDPHIDVDDNALELRKSAKARKLMSRLLPQALALLLSLVLFGLWAAFRFVEVMNRHNVGGVPATMFVGWLAVFGVSTVVLWSLSFIIEWVLRHTIIPPDLSSDWPRQRAYFRRYLTIGLVALTYCCITPVMLANLNNGNESEDHHQEKTDAFFYLLRTFVLITIVGLARAAVYLLEEVVVRYINRSTMSEQILQHLNQERVIQTLCRGMRLRVATAVNNNNGSCKDSEATWGLQFLKEKNLAHLASSSFHSFVGRLGNIRAVLYTGDSTPEERSIRTATKIMMNVDTAGKGFITLQDLYPFFEDEEDARKAFAEFDQFARGRATTEDVTSVVLKVQTDKKALYDNLLERRDMATIFDKVVAFVFWIIILVIAVPVYGGQITHVLLPLSSFFLGFSFVFGESVKGMWESILAIFVIRPFELGDRIELGSSGTLQVVKMHLLSSEAVTPDGRLHIIPNNQFFRNVVVNHKRGGDYSVIFPLNIDAHTPQGLLNDFEKRVRKFFSVDTQAPWKSETLIFWVAQVGDESVKYITVRVWIQVRGVSWQIPSQYLRVSGIAQTEVCKIAQEMGVVMAEKTPQPVVTQAEAAPATLAVRRRRTSMGEQRFSGLGGDRE
eukprot:m51a1_g12614 hypothetical protein (629) ;mRNA; f:1439-4005